MRPREDHTAEDLAIFEHASSLVRLAGQLSAQHSDYDVARNWAAQRRQGFSSARIAEHWMP